MTEKAQQEFADRIALLEVVRRSLGLGDRRVRRAVLDIDLSGAVKVFLEELVTQDFLENLVAEIPRVSPHVQWVDRVAVENANGTEIVVKQLDTEDGEARELCMQLIHLMKHCEPEKFAKIKNLLYAVQP